MHSAFKHSRSWRFSPGVRARIRRIWPCDPKSFQSASTPVPRSAIHSSGPIFLNNISAWTHDHHRGSTSKDRIECSCCSIATFVPDLQWEPLRLGYSELKSGQCETCASPAIKFDGDSTGSASAFGPIADSSRSPIDAHRRSLQCNCLIHIMVGTHRLSTMH